MCEVLRKKCLDMCDCYHCERAVRREEIISFGHVVPRLTI